MICSDVSEPGFLELNCRIGTPGGTPGSAGDFLNPILPHSHQSRSRDGWSRTLVLVDIFFLLIPLIAQHFRI